METRAAMKTRLSNCMNQNASCEVNGRPFSEAICRLLRNPDVHHRARRGPPPPNL
jgi:hypothetical protein